MFDMHTLPRAVRLTAAWRRRRVRQAILWIGLWAVIVGGFFYPLIGLLVAGCFLGALAVGAFRGRQWCDWTCPRGAFNDFVLAGIRRGREIPAWLRHPGVRIGVLAVMMTVMVTGLVRAGGDLAAIGRVFWTLLTVTTAVGVVLGLAFHQRAWCTICPAGTMASWLGRSRPPRLELDGAACTSCGLCAKACPLDLRPADGIRATGRMSADCLKCGVCVEACPTAALSFTGSRTETREEVLA